jgi:hypothetical protein
MESAVFCLVYAYVIFFLMLCMWRRYLAQYSADSPTINKHVERRSGCVEPIDDF